jgi:N-formylglutamate amidohydrolase
MANQAEGSQQSPTQVAVLHIPHSSRHVSVEGRRAICLDDAALDSELLRMTDAYTDELFPVTPVEADRVIFPLSRLVCDVERFPFDEDEPMAKRGMGATYNRTAMGDVLRAPSNAHPADDEVGLNGGLVFITATPRQGRWRTEHYDCTTL